MRELPSALCIVSTYVQLWIKIPHRNFKLQHELISFYHLRLTASLIEIQLRQKAKAKVVVNLKVNSYNKAQDNWELKDESKWKMKWVGFLTL
jgi:hypothetical protein